MVYMDSDGTGQPSPMCLLHPSGNLAQMCFVAAARASAETQDSLVKLLLAIRFSQFPLAKADPMVKSHVNVGR